MSSLNTLKIRFTKWRALRGIHAPIFIVGCGHSGTSLLKSVLGAHSRIHAIPEETNFAFAKPRVMWRRMLEFRRQTFAAGKSRWVEKTPKHVHKIPELLSLHPGGRVIVIVRDGRDVAVSLAKRFGDLRAGAERWVRDNQQAFRSKANSRVQWVKYEDIVEDYEATLTRLLRGLSESYEEAMNEFRRTKPRSDIHREKPPDERGENHVRYRQWQLSQPLFDGRGRFRELSPEDLAMVEGIQRELLQYFGYPLSDTRPMKDIPT